jgi:hypothetical protein
MLPPKEAPETPDKEVLEGKLSPNARAPRDRLGEFLAKYEEYLDGSLPYSDMQEAMLKLARPQVLSSTPSSNCDLALTRETAQSLCAWCRNHPQEDILAEARRLLGKGYYQTSRRHRRLARLPEGKTGRQALCAALPNEQWVNSLTEAEVGGHYLRIYSPEEDRVTIACSRVFAAFQNLGGETYLEEWSD